MQQNAACEVPKLLNRFPAFYETRRFITVLTIARHLPPSSARLIQSKPHHSTSLTAVWISFSPTRLNLPSGSFPQVSHENCIFLHTYNMPARLVRLDLMVRIFFGNEHKSCSSSFCHFHLPPVTTNFLLLWSKHLLCILFTNTLSLYSSINVSDRSVHTHT
jgi:hypothetical protein